MNAKKAKFIRRGMRLMGVDWRETKYIDSSHPKEQPHTKEYPLALKKWTKAGVRNITQYVPMKVGTRLLDGCGKYLYRDRKLKLKMGTP